MPMSLRKVSGFSLPMSSLCYGVSLFSLLLSCSMELTDANSNMIAVLLGERFRNVRQNFEFLLHNLSDVFAYEVFLVTDSDYCALRYFSQEENLHLHVLNKTESTIEDEHVVQNNQRQWFKRKLAAEILLEHECLTGKKFDTVFVTRSDYLLHKKIEDWLSFPLDTRTFYMNTDLAFAFHRENLELLIRFFSAIPKYYDHGTCRFSFNPLTYLAADKSAGKFGWLCLSKADRDALNTTSYLCAPEGDPSGCRSYVQHFLDSPVTCGHCKSMGNPRWSSEKYFLLYLLKEDLIIRALRHGFLAMERKKIESKPFEGPCDSTANI